MPRSSRKKLWTAIIVFMLLLVVTGGLAFHFRSEIKQSVWNWRAQSLVDKAETEAEAGSWDVAFRRALAAHQLSPALYSPRRILFTTALETADPVLPRAAAALFTHPESTTEDKTEVLTTLLARRELGTFIQLHRMLPPETREEPPIDAVFIRFLAAAGASAQARERADLLLQRDPAPEYRLLSTLLLLLPDASDEELARGLGLAGELMEEDPGLGRQAFLALEAIPLGRIKPDQLGIDLTAWMAALPEPSPREQLLAAFLGLLDIPDPAQQQAAFRGIIDRFQEASPEPLCAWLSRLGRFDTILTLVDETRGRETLPLYLFRFQALIALQGPAPAQEWLEDPHPDAQHTEIAIARAKVAQAAGNRDQSLSHWEDAFLNAERNLERNDLLLVYQSALQSDEPDIAVRALLESARRPGAPLPPSATLQGVLAYLKQNDRLDDMHTLTQTLLRNEPDNPILRNNFAYLSLLLGRNENDALEMSQQLVEEFPEITDLRTTLAFGYLQTGQPEKALEIIESEPENAKSTPEPANLAIRALVLEHNGRPAEAAEIRAQIDHQQLTFQEQRALAEYRPEE